MDGSTAIVAPEAPRVPVEVHGLDGLVRLPDVPVAALVAQTGVSAPSTPLSDRPFVTRGAVRFSTVVKEAFLVGLGAREVPAALGAAEAALVEK